MLYSTEYQIIKYFLAMLFRIKRLRENTKKIFAKIYAK